MTDRTSAIQTLEQWLADPSGIDKDAVRQLFGTAGYSEQRAVDYRDVVLYYRRGWPRYTIMDFDDEPGVPVGVLHHIATSLLPRLRDENSQ